METIKSSRYNEPRYTPTCMVGALLLRHQFAEGQLHRNNFDDYNDDGKWYYNNYGTVEYMVPSKIRFAHDNISKIFSGEPHTGYPIKTLADKLVKGKMQPEDMKPLSVVVDNDRDKVYTLGNRRLWALREAERRGKCTEIPVRIKPFRINMHKEMFTTRNDGQSVQIRNSGSDAQSWSGPQLVNPNFRKYTCTIRNHRNNRGNRTRRLIDTEMKEQAQPFFYRGK